MYISIANGVLPVPPRYIFPIQIIGILNKHNFNVIDNDNEFKYLLKMPMDSVSQENIDDLTNKLHNIETELDKLKSITINELWLNDLLELKKHYNAFNKK